MSAFDRLELITEIESAARSLGMEKLTVLSKLSDLTDNQLMLLDVALREIAEVSA